MSQPRLFDLPMEPDLDTPSLIYDEAQLADNIIQVRSCLNKDYISLLYAMKAFSVPSALRSMVTLLDGFHSSSLNESRLGRELLGREKLIHFTSPGLCPQDIQEVCRYCDSLSFNSISQWQRFKTAAFGKVSCGLRINPEISLVEDSRYNPCGPDSKLGEPLSVVSHIVHENPGMLAGIEGVLIHSNCDCSDFEPLKRTVDHIVDRIGRWLNQLAWIDLGGGYLFQSCPSSSLGQAIKALRRVFSGQIMVEPGAAIIRSAVVLVATVQDIRTGDSQPIAILDASINHLPEVFEYQFEPEVTGDTPTGQNTYLLAGSSCLAGDVFGTYSFLEPLAIGSRIVFEQVGAYSFVKANMFNGINLPTIYRVTKTRQIERLKSFRYEDFISICGGP